MSSIHKPQSSPKQSKMGSIQSNGYQIPLRTENDAPSLQQFEKRSGYGILNNKSLTVNLILSTILLTFFSLIVSCQADSPGFNVNVDVDTNVINANAIYTFQMVVPSVDSGLAIKVIIPFELTVQATSGSQLTYCKEIVELASSAILTNNLACTYTTNMATLQNYITFTTPTAYPSINSYSWSFGYIKNPGSSYQYYEITPMEAYVSGGIPYGSATDLAVSYSPGSITSATLVQANFGTAQAGGTDTYTFKFKISNNVPRYGLMQFIFPSAFQSAPGNLASLSSVTIYGTSAGSISVTYTGVAPLLATFDNIFSSSGVTASTSQYIIVTFTGIKNPSAVGTTSSFTINTLDDNGYIIDTISTGLTVTVTNAGGITITQFTPIYTTVDTQNILSFKVVPSVGFQSGGFIDIVGPTLYVKTSSPPVCTPSSGFASNGIAPVCTVPNTYTVRMAKDLATSYTIIYFNINSFINPLGVTTLPSFELYFKNSDNSVVSKVTTGLTFTTTPGTCTVTSAVRSGSLVVGTSSTYLINFSCTHRITSIGKIIMIFPIDQADYQAITTCADGITSSAIPCTSTSNSGLLQITATQWCSSSSSDCPAGASLSLKLLNTKNPGYIVPTLTSSVIVRTQNSLNSQWLTVDEKLTGIVVTQNLIPGTISNLAIARSASLLTGAVTTFTFTFTATTAIPSGGQIKITFPDKTAYQNQPTPGITCTSSVGSATCASVGNSADSTVVLSVTWTAACPSGCAAGQAFTLSVTNVYNPFSTIANTLSTYTIGTSTSTNYVIDQGTATSAQPTLTPNALTASLSAPTSPIMVGAVASYTVVVQNPNNRLPSSANGGSLVIILPPETLLTSTTCTASSSSITLTCSGNTGTRTLTVTSPSDIAKGSTITVNMANNVRNPQTGQPSTVFKINSYYNGAGIDTSATLTVTCDTPNAVLNAVSTRGSTTINDITTFKISFSTTNPIPSGSVVYIKLPNDQAVLTSSSATTVSATYQQSSTSNTVNRPVTYSAPYSVLNVGEWCSADNGGSFCPSTFTSTISLIGFSNPSTAVAATLSVQIEVKTSPPNYYIIDSVTVGIITTPYVNYGPLQSVTLSRSSDVVGAITTLTIVFVTNSNANALLTGYSVNVYLSLPVSFLYQKSGVSTVCTSAITGSTSTSPSCSPIIAATDPQNMGSYAQSITFSLPCSTASPCNPSQSFTVTIAGLINPYSTKANTGTLTTATQSQATNGGLFSVINSLDTTNIGTQLNSYTPNVITVNSVVRSVTTVGAAVVLTFDLVLTNRLQKNGYVVFDISTSQFVPNGASFTYQYYSGGSYSSSNTLTQTVTSASTNTFQIKEWCNGGANYCPDGYNMKFRIMTGLNNLGYVAVPTTYISITTMTSDQLGKTDYITGVIATPALTAAVLTISSLTLGSTAVAAADIPLDIKVIFGAPVTSGSQIMLSFGAEFVRIDKNVMTCADYTTGTAVSLACTKTSASGVLNTVTLTNMCSSGCTSTGSYVIRLVDINNKLYQAAFTGTLTIQVLTSAGNQVSVGTYAQSSVTTLVPGIIASPTVVRSQALQGKTSTFTLSFSTPGILMLGSEIEIDLPLNQIIIQSGTSAFIAKDSSGNTLTYTTLTATATYNKIKFTQWKCATATCNPPVTFQLTLTNSANPYVQTTTYDDFVIKFTKTTTGEAIFNSPTPLLATPTLQFSPITNIVITMFSSVYVSTTPTYTISFTTTSDMPIGGKFKFTFPAGRALQQSSSSIQCSSGGTTYGCSTVWSTYLIVNVNNYCASKVCPAGSYSFTFSGNMINPPTVPTADLNFIIDSTDSSGNIINEGKILNSLVTPILPGSITVASVVRGSTSLSANTDYTVTFKVVNAVPSTGFFRTIVALDQVTMPSSAPNCKMGFVLTSVACPIIFKNTQFEYLDIPQTCGSSGCSAGSTVTIVISSVTNPSVFSANSVTSTWSVYTMTSAKEYIDGIYANLQATPPLVGKSVLVLLAEMDSYVVQTSTNIRIAFQPGAQFTNAALFDIYFPDGFATSTSSSNTCILLEGLNMNMNCIYSNYPSGYLQKVQLLNPCPNQCQSDSSYFYQIPIITRGDVYPVPGVFSVVCRYQYVDVGMGTLNNAMTLIPAAIKQYYLTNHDCDTIDQQCSLYLSFKLINSVPTASGRGRISITIPSQIIVQANQCYATLDQNSAVATCSQSGNSIVVTHNSATSPAGYNITIRMSYIQNPGSTAPTDSFIIQSEWDVLNNKKYYAIDQISSGVTYQVHIMTPLNSLEITRQAGTLNAGYMTGSPTTLQFKFSLKHSLVATSTFQITLPTAAEVMLNPYASSYTCYQTDSNGNNLNLLLCQAQNSTVIMVRNYCQVGSCGSSDTVYFRMYDDFMQNYYYLITPADVSTQAVTVRTTTAQGLYNIDESKVIPTPDLQPTPLIMPSPEVIRTSNIIGQKVQWVLNFKINKNPVPTGGYVYITIPQGVLLPVQSGSMEISNYDTKKPIYNFTTLNYSDGTSIQAIQINNFCSATQICGIGSAFSIQLDWIKNPMIQLDVKQSIVIQTRTSQGYIVEQGTTVIVNNLFSQLIPISLEHVFIRPIDPSVGVTTTYEISFSSDADFSATDVLSLGFPTELNVLATTTSRRRLATVSSSRCRSILDPIINITCEVISKNLVYIYGLFRDNIKTYTVSVDNIKNPPAVLTTSAMPITVQNKAGLLIAGKYTNTNIVIQAVIDQSTCNKVCKTCAGTTATCTSCAVPSKYPLFKQYQCTDDCGTGYFVNKQTPANNLSNLPQCVQCHHACDTCYGAGYDKCFSCASGYLMENGKCVQWCSKGISYNTTLKQCINSAQNCDSNCKTCSTNTSYCLSCDQSSSTPVYDATQGKCIAKNQNLCNGTSSSRFYIDSTVTSNPQCKICSSLCMSCQNQQDQCSACWGADFFTNRVINELYQTCVEKCGLGTWFNSPINTCSYCNPVSLLCTGYGSEQALACNKTPEGQQLYLYANTCVLDCPSKYTTNTQANICEKGQASLMSFSFIFMIAAIIIGLLVVLTSFLIAKRKDKSMDILYAVTSMLEFINRICVLGNLWTNSSVFSLAVCFMNLIVTCALGIFFNFLFMTPIYAHSPHFRQVYKKNSCTFQTVTAISYLAGMNVMRLLCSGMYGLNQLKADLTSHKFYLVPLNTMANFTIIFTFCQLGVCAFILIKYSPSDDIFLLGVFGIIMNMILIILQLLKHLNTKAFLAKTTD